MHVRIRKTTAITKDNDLVLVVSKTALIAKIQEMIHEKLGVEIAHQKLYYMGKQLVPVHRVMDYDMKLNDVIQLTVKTDTDEIKTGNEMKKHSDVEISDDEQTPKKEVEMFEATSLYFKNGDLIEVVDNEIGAWFEAKVVGIYKTTKSENIKETDLIFRVRMDRTIETSPFDAKFHEIRPRSFYTFPFTELKVGMIVFANYDIENPGRRGYWFDFEVTNITKTSIAGTLLVGTERLKLLENCEITFIREIMRIEESTLISEAPRRRDKHIPMRTLPLYCETCNDNSAKNCKECGCFVCAKKESVGVLIICDECHKSFHLLCLTPPLSEIPTTKYWYCPNCKNDPTVIVRAGERLKLSKKKMKMASNKVGATTRDWGNGMACVGRTSICTIVPIHHSGPVPGVDVGTCWKFRLQVSEAGIHRPHVAGIHGRESDGAYSIVLSGGYEDDVDNGEEFFYTGSGGRDLSGNKRVSGQSSDQKLTRMNKALAMNCNVKFNNKKGGEAKDWKKGKPVRVVRNYKLGKHSKYAPAEGNRYDGLYKVVKYYPEKGKSGFIVWRYLLRRDDPTPAPWDTKKGGQEFPVIYPPGYLEAEEVKAMDAAKKSTKRKKQSSPNPITNYVAKKVKVEEYKIDKKLKELIKDDAANKKLWDECQETIVEGKQNFLSKVRELFLCVCCQEVVFQPVTLGCKHNICQGCLKRSFSAELYMCPLCRFELGEKYRMKVNATLGKILKEFFPGYDAGRR